MTRSPQTAVLIFDGDCGFCTSTTHWLLARVRTPVRAVPWQRVDLAQYGLTERDVERYVWWIDPLGRRFRGHLAVSRALAVSSNPWPVIAWFLRTPPWSWAAAVGYRLVARFRGYLPGGTPACRLPPAND